MPLAPPEVGGAWEFEPIDEPVHKYWPCIRASRDGQSSYVVSSARRALAIPGVAEVEAVAANLHSSADHTISVQLAPTFPNSSAALKGWTVKANELAAMDEIGDYKWASACIKHSSWSTTLFYILSDKNMSSTQYLPGVGPQAGQEHSVSTPTPSVVKHSFSSLSISEIPRTGRLAVVYGSTYDSNGYVPDIHMSIIDSNGHEALAAFPVSYLAQGRVPPLTADTFPRVTSFVLLKTTYIAVAWNRRRQDGSRAIIARVFDSKAMPVTPEIVVSSNNAAVGVYSRPSVAAIDEVGFAVTWNATSDSKLNAYFSVYGPIGQSIIQPTGISRTNAGAMLAPFVAACRWRKGALSAPNLYYVISWQQVSASDIVPMCAVFRYAGNKLDKTSEFALETTPGPTLACADSNEYVRTELFCHFEDHLIAGFAWSRQATIPGGGSRVDVKRAFIAIE